MRKIILPWEKTWIMKNSFAFEEARCESLFFGLGQCRHLYTPENHPVFLTGEVDFKAAMTILAICALSFPSVRILTFQWMSNHLHITLYGPEEDILSMFDMLRKYLGKYLKSKEKNVSLASWTCRMRQIDSLADIRNVIAYNNRNGFLVKPDFTPFNYPWGANRFFFNPDAKKRYEATREALDLKTIRNSFRTHKLDSFVGTPCLDGHIPAQAFCNLETAEGLYRDARHYFYSVSKNVEKMKEIAKETGESIFYTDEDLYSVIYAMCAKRFGVNGPHLLPAEAKIEIAKEMHYEYNAGAKQICRILRLEPSVLNAILPQH